MGAVKDALIDCDGKDKLQSFEQENDEMLKEKFIEKYANEWQEFVFERFEENEADYSDYLYEQETVFDNAARRKTGD